MNTLSKLLFGAFVAMPATLSAQDDIILHGQDEAYPQKYTPQYLQGYQNDSYGLSKKGLVNTRGGIVLKSGKIDDYTIHPSGSVFAALHQAGKDKVITIYDLWRPNRKVAKAKLKTPATSLCYSVDGTRLFVCDTLANFCNYRTIDYKQATSLTLPFVGKRMTASPDGRFAAVTNGADLAIVSLNTNSIFRELQPGGEITAMDFSTNSENLAVLTSDGNLTVYNTTDFTPRTRRNAMGEARDCSYHPDGKYVSVVTGDSRIALVNLVDAKERIYVDAAGGGVTDVRFCKDPRGGLYMVYNTTDALHYKLMNELPAYLTKLVDEEVRLRMEQWEMRMEGESLEDYRMRVNDDTRQMQMRLFEEEIATRMALESTTLSLMALESYNPETGMMALDMGEMNNIYIQVPKEELVYFMSPEDLEIRNPIYCIGEDDKYQLVYADIYNPKTGKTYSFNNRERKSLEYLTSDDRFLPLAYARQTTMDEMHLDEIKNDIVTAAMQSNSISEHTQINVSTKMLHEVDAEGNKQINYQVSFAYTVDAEFSEREDFASGRYKAEDSAAAQAMLQIINQALQKDFALYTGAGKQVKVSITGSADATPIRKALAYGGEYGNFEDEPVFKNGQRTTISVSRESGIVSNDQLAFLRATGMKQNVISNVTALRNMDAQYDTHIEQAEGVGGEFRRIHVDFIFYKAF